MEANIAAAEGLVDRHEISEEDRAALIPALAKARAALDRYRTARARKDASASTLGAIGVASAAILADDATVVGVADDPALIGLGLAAIVVAIQAHAPSTREELASSWLELGQQLEALDSTVMMTSSGKVIHDHLVVEARKRILARAAAKGESLKESQITREMLCEELNQMLREYRRSNTIEWMKTISTQKGLGCRGSRSNRE
jgi:hypothetical protein